MNEYQDKYLKYKFKYDSLLNGQEGGFKLKTTTQIRKQMQYDKKNTSILLQSIRKALTQSNKIVFKFLAAAIVLAISNKSEERITPPFEQISIFLLISNTSEKLIDLSRLFSSSVISTVSFKSLLETSYSEGITKLKIACLPISVEAKEDKCLFNKCQSRRFKDSSSTKVSVYEFLD